MSSQIEHVLIVTCVLGFTATEFVTRRYQANVCGRATANDAWLEALMFISLAAVTRPIALLGSNILRDWLIPVQHNARADLP